MEKLILTILLVSLSLLAKAENCPYAFTRNPTTNKLCVVQASGGITYFSSTQSIKFNGIVTITELDSFDIVEDTLLGAPIGCNATGAHVGGSWETFMNKKCGPAGTIVTGPNKGNTYCFNTSAFLCKAKFIGWDESDYIDTDCPIACNEDDDVILFFLDWEIANGLINNN